MSELRRKNGSFQQNKAYGFVLSNALFGSNSPIKRLSFIFLISFQLMSKIAVIHFEIDDSELNEVENLPKIQRRQANDAETSERRKGNNEGGRFDYRGVKEVPFSSFFVPKSQEGRNELEEASSYSDKCPKEGGYNTEASLPAGWSAARDGNNFRTTGRKWRGLREKAPRKKRVPLRYLSPSDADTAARYLDYTNSQMPFNEGKMRKSLQTSNAKIAGETLNGGKLYFNIENCFDAEVQPKRLGRSMRRRFELPLRFQEKSLETDDPLLEYSRVRRFLDQERAKQRVRMSTTLEAKEAAMSRVLDPNLNSDGILEPHVRKRRGGHSKKRDLSFSQRHRRRRRNRMEADYIYV